MPGRYKGKNMNNSTILRFFLFIYLSAVFFNATGCATNAVWEKRTSNVETVIDETNANAKGFFSKCKDIRTFNNEIIISFETNKNTAQFPPFKEGYMVISSDEKAEYVIQRINEVQTSKDRKISVAYVEADFWQTTDPDKKTKYWSSYKFGLKNIHGHTTRYGTKGPSPGHKNSADIKIRFIQRAGNSTVDLDCESLTRSPVSFDITFTQGSLKYSEYKNSLGYRIVTTPFSVAADVITSPIQLLAILTVPVWAPQ